MTRALDLSGAGAKLERALVHLNSLGDTFEAMANEAADQFSLAPEERSPYGDKTRILLRVGSLISPPPATPLIAGDYLQNLRAVLDHIAWELVVKGDNPEPARPQRVMFPIYDSARSSGNRSVDSSVFRARLHEALPGVDEERIEVVSRYQSPDPDNWQLQALARLSNRDKHQILTPVRLLSTGEIKQHHLRPTVGNIVGWRRLLSDGEPLHERSALLEAIVDDADAEVELLVTITTPVAFEEQAGVYRRTKELEAIGEVVAGIAAEFARRWGGESAAAACAAWPERARQALGIVDQ
jgi:hypothetical protein